MAMRGLIYKLTSVESPAIYVGSTTKSLMWRYGKHVTQSAITPNRKCYKHILEFGWDKYKIELVEEYCCADKLELRKREDHWILELKATLNCNRACRSPKQWRIDNKDKIKAYRDAHKEEAKAYREAHKQEAKAYRDSHKDRAKELQSQRVTCTCGKSVRKYNLSKHLLTRNHSSLIQTANPPVSV